MGRPSRDLYFLAMAKLVATRSTCLRLKVGAVLVDGDHHVISTGYCGAPRGIPHCTPATCGPTGRCHLTVHAEANALLFAPRPVAGERKRTLYVTHFPCDDCARLIVQGGVARVVYIHPYHGSTPFVFTEGRIEVVQFSEEEIDAAFNVERSD